MVVKEDREERKKMGRRERKEEWKGNRLNRTKKEGEKEGIRNN